MAGAALTYLLQVRGPAASARCEPARSEGRSSGGSWRRWTPGSSRTPRTCRPGWCTLRSATQHTPALLSDFPNQQQPTRSLPRNCISVGFISPEVQDLADPQCSGGVCASASPIHPGSFAALNWECPDAPWAVRFNNQTNMRHHIVVTTTRNTSQGRDAFFPSFYLSDPWFKSLNYNFIVRNNSRQKKYSPDFLELTWMYITYHHNVDEKKNYSHIFCFSFLLEF